MHEDILEKLYRQYYSAALLYALSLCRDRQLAEELVQEAFVRAYLSLGDDAPSFPYWLMKVCRNLYYDHARRQKFLTDAPIPERADNTTPESVLLEKEDAAALFRAMGQLEVAERELIALHYFAARPIHESAEILGLPYAAARQKLRRARMKLRRLMEEDGYEI